MVDSWYCLDRVVPERMTQIWRRSEVRNHKRRSLNTQLSSGTSANTSFGSRNAPGRMIRSDLFWYGNTLKMKSTYREKNLLDYLFRGFRCTLKSGVGFIRKVIGIWGLLCVNWGICCIWPDEGDWCEDRIFLVFFESYPLDIFCVCVCVEGGDFKLVSWRKTAVHAY